MWGALNFLQGPPKMNIFYANFFFYILWKKSRNKLCLEPHDTYVLFGTFFSQMNNKQKIFQVCDLLIGPMLF